MDGVYTYCFRNQVSSEPSKNLHSSREIRSSYFPNALSAEISLFLRFQSFFIVVTNTSQMLTMTPKAITSPSTLRSRTRMLPELLTARHKVRFDFCWESRSLWNTCTNPFSVVLLGSSLLKDSKLDHVLSSHLSVDNQKLEAMVRELSTALMAVS